MFTVQPEEARMDEAITDRPRDDAPPATSKDNAVIAAAHTALPGDADAELGSAK